MSRAENPGIAVGRRAWRDFLTAERVRLYAGAMLVTHLAVLVGFVLLDLLGERTTSFSGNDFRVFWAASRLGLDGHGLDAYDIGRLFPLQQSVAPGLAEAKPWQHWFYPPPFLLAVLPLALLPYFLSFLVFNAAACACFFGFCVPSSRTARLPWSRSRRRRSCSRWPTARIPCSRQALPAWR